MIKLNNYFKISIAIFLCCFNSGIYGHENNICCIKQFDTEQNKEMLKTFFGDIHYIKKGMNLKRCDDTNKLNKILELSSSTEYGIDSYDDTVFSDLSIQDNRTMFFDQNSTLSMGVGSLINIQNGKVLINGRLKIEPGCIINIGEKSNNKHDNENNNKGYTSYLIINSNIVNLHNITINLNNANSHLEIHGNDINISNCKFNVFNKKATLHIHDELLNNFSPV